MCVRRSARGDSVLDAVQSPDGDPHCAGLNRMRVSVDPKTQLDMHIFHTTLKGINSPRTTVGLAVVQVYSPEPSYFFHTELQSVLPQSFASDLESVHDITVLNRRGQGLAG